MIQWASKSLLRLGLPIKQITLAALDGAPLADLDAHVKGGEFEVVSLQAAAQVFALAALLAKLTQIGHVKRLATHRRRHRHRTLVPGFLTLAKIMPIS